MVFMKIAWTLFPSLRPCCRFCRGIKRVFIPDGMCSQGKLQRPQQSPVCSSACTYLSDYSDVNINPPRLSSKFVGFFLASRWSFKAGLCDFGEKAGFCDYCVWYLDNSFNLKIFRQQFGIYLLVRINVKRLYTPGGHVSLDCACFAD